MLNRTSTHIIAAIALPRMVTIIATGFGHQRVVAGTIPLRNHTNTVTGKNRTPSIVRTRACLTSLVVECLCGCMECTLGPQIGFSRNA